MTEYRDVLERVADRGPMPEPALDRIVRRRERRRRNRRISAGVLGMVITAILVLTLVHTLAAVIPQPATVPTLSPSNGWIAYTLGDRGIYLVTEGQAPRLAIGTPGDGVIEWCPAFSPDGTHLAFTRVGPGGGTVRTFVADVGKSGVVAGTERLVASFQGEYWACPAWAPDGARLLYADAEGVWAVPLATNESAVLIGRFADLVHWEWSPDGSMVAVVVRDGEVFVISARDGTLITTANGPPGASVSWSPSGDRLAVGASDTGDLSPVLLLDIANGDLHELTASGRSFIGYGDPSWSPDGTSIALRDHHEPDKGIVIVRVDDGTWYRIPLPTLDVPDVWALRWSPDGQRLLVASGCSVYSLPANGSGKPILVSSPDVNPERCQVPPGLDWQPVFS